MMIFMYKYKSLYTIILQVLLAGYQVIVVADSSSQLDFTEKQRAWLKEHPVIRLASDNAWPPFEWVDENKRFKGIANDYMQIIEKNWLLSLCVISINHGLKSLTR